MGVASFLRRRNALSRAAVAFPDDLNQVNPQVNPQGNPQGNPLCTLAFAAPSCHMLIPNALMGQLGDASDQVHEPRH